MKKETHGTRLGMLMVTAAASLLVACAMEGAEGDGEGGDEAWGEQVGLTQDEPTTTEEGSAETGEELDIAATPERAESDVELLATCREVVIGSIPVYASSTGSVVRCSFFSGDVFQHSGLVNGRYRTWCPRGAPPPPVGTTSYAQASGTVAVTCPF